MSPDRSSGRGRSQGRSGGRPVPTGDRGSPGRRSGGHRDQPAVRDRPGRGADGSQVEGRQAVRELLRAGRRPVRQLFMAGPGRADALADIVDLAEAAGVPVRVVGRDQIDAMALTDAPQGVIATAAPVPERDLSELLRREPDGPAPFLVVLDGVTDPHNVGAVMRSALCAGASGLVVGRHRSGHLTPAALKAAAGAVEYLPVATVAGIPAALSLMAEAGVWTVGLDAGGPSRLWDLTVATEPVAVVLGAEGRGLSPLARQRCEVVVSVPMSGPLESLNVSAAAALACFEIARRRAVPA